MDFRLQVLVVPRTDKHLVLLCMQLTSLDWLKQSSWCLPQSNLNCTPYSLDCGGITCVSLLQGNRKKLRSAFPWVPEKHKACSGHLWLEKKARRCHWKCSMSACQHAMVNGLICWLWISLNVRYIGNQDLVQNSWWGWPVTIAHLWESFLELAAFQAQCNSLIWGSRGKSANPRLNWSQRLTVCPRRTWKAGRTLKTSSETIQLLDFLEGNQQFGMFRK